MARCENCGKNLTFALLRAQVPDDSGKMHNLCLDCHRKLLGNNGGAGKAFKYDNNSKKIVVVDIGEVEVRKKCNICGHIFCYVPMDEIQNKREVHRELNRSILSGISGLASAGSVRGAIDRQSSSNSLNNALNQIIDYNQCPKCGSRNLQILSKEAYKKEQLTNIQNTDIQFVDELKKYKELLDSGVITEEEFNAKKKQLLGL